MSVNIHTHKYLKPVEITTVKNKISEIKFHQNALNYLMLDTVKFKVLSPNK